MKAAEARVWVNLTIKAVHVTDTIYGPSFRRSGGGGGSIGWCDPIGAAYSQWLSASNKDRLILMRETVIELVMQGFDCGHVLREFAKVDEFKALGSASYPMCRALTSALVGKCLEPNTMSFNELLVAYR